MGDVLETKSTIDLDIVCSLSLSLSLSDEKLHKNTLLSVLFFL